VPAGYLEPLAKANRWVLVDHRGHGTSDHSMTLSTNHSTDARRDPRAGSQTGSTSAFL